MEEAINLIIRARDGLVFNEKVWAVSSTNDIGPFDVLPNHANFICTIKEKVSIHKGRNNLNSKIINLENGILRVKENLVEIFLGI